MCRAYFCSQEIDSLHATEHRSTDQSRNGCRMCHFCHAQLFEITHAENIKSPLEQHSCRNAKVVEAFWDAGCRLSTRCRPPIHQPPVDALRRRIEMPRALSRPSVRADMQVVSRYRPVRDRPPRSHQIPIALAASQCPTPRDFVPWRFSAAGRISAWKVLRRRRLKTCT
jgi:hypothetical protein